MSEFIEIYGGRTLRGTVQISGAKNAALPMLIASLLTSEPCVFSNIPNLEDVNLTLSLLENFGANTSYSSGAEHGAQVTVAVPALAASEASYSLVKALRASFWVLAPLLARGRAARVALPGGDIIGARPVDLHLAALTQMGAEIRVKHGTVLANAVNGLRPADIVLRFPSVGATHQIMMAAALTPGTTTIKGAAREPEVVALASMLSAMGADIEGAGSDLIAISGAESLGGVTHNLIGDRIEAGTYLLAAAASAGEVTAQGIDPKFFGSFLEILDQMGIRVETTSNSISINAPDRLRPVHLSTAPFPGLATDLQALLMAVLTLADGESTIEENVFEGRFGHVAELCRMGAQIRVEDRVATVVGVPSLSGAEVEALDIRAGAALVIAGIAAQGTTTIHEPHHLRRGYEALELKLQGLGAQIGRKISDADDFAFSGC